MSNRDREFMQTVLDLAAKGRGRTSPNPMVGALIVKNGKVVGSGWHRVCGGPHAEVLALRQAGAKARGATLYVNLEPCCHFGRTPPCVDAVIQSGVRRVVIGMKDPNPMVSGRSISRLRRKGIEVRTGVLKDECARLNRAFITWITENRPYVVAKTAQTFDGKIATAAGESQWITDEKTRAFARRRRREFDAIMVGIRTVLKDDPHLDRPAGRSQKARPFKKIVLDSRLRIPLTAGLLKKDSARDCLVVATNRADPDRVRQVRERGAQVLLAPSQNGRVRLQWLFEELAVRGVTSVLIEGGGQLIAGALATGLIDRMDMYLAPKIIGDREAVNAVDGLGLRPLSEAVRLNIELIRPVGRDILVEAGVVYSSLMKG